MNSVTELIHKVLWDKRYIFVPSFIECDESILIMRDPTISERNRYLFLKENKLREALEASVPSEVEVFANAIKNGYWTSEDKRIMSETSAHIQFLQSELKKHQKFIAQKKSFEKQIKEAQNQFHKTSLKETELKIKSAEYLAHEFATFDLLRKLVFKLDESLLWPSEEIFLKTKQKYPDYIMYLASCMTSEGDWEMSALRKIAKSGEWRLTWVLNRENLSSIFGKSVGELNSNQKLLIYWSRIYDIAYEDTEKPDQDIIDDDDKFDEWLANRDLKKQESNTANDKTNNHHENINVISGYYIETCTCGADKNKKLGLGESTRHANDCPWGTWKSYTKEEKEAIASQVYGRNTKTTRDIINREQEIIEKKGIVDEKDLRDKKSRQFLGSKVEVHKIHR